MKTRLTLLLLLLAPLACLASDVVRLRWTPQGVSMKPKRVAGVTLSAEGGYAVVESTDTARELRFVLSGSCPDGALIFKGKHKVCFELAGLTLTSLKGSPLDIRCGKRVTLDLRQGTSNTLSDEAGTPHKAVIRCKGHLVLSGQGSLTINARGATAVKAKEYVRLAPSLGTLDIKATGDGCKGIRTKADFIMQGGQVSIATTGNYLAEDTTSDFPPMPFGPGEMPEGDSLMPRPPFPDFGGGGMPMPDSLFLSLREQMPEGDSLMPRPPFPDFGGGGMPMPDSLFLSRIAEAFGFPDFEGFDGQPPFDGMPPMRPRYIGTAKAVKAQGSIIIEGGQLTVSTSTPGAEGLEGKQGVTLSGGTVSVTAYDDAINANGKILFSGADVRAVSLRNDAVDSNGWGDGSITISAGRVSVFSGAGPPEEGFDSDQWAIVIEGGEALSVGSGMGPYPSMPNASTASQPYLLFQSLSVAEGDKLTVTSKEGGELIAEAVSPVANPVNHSLVTSPLLLAGHTYVLSINGKPAQERQAEPQ